MRIFHFISSLLIIVSLTANAQNADWYNLDPVTDGIMGVAATRAYSMLPEGRTIAPVIVAVIDDGVDINHPDFDGVIWVNKNEIPGNGIDDDRNGYIDDVHGWNFLGNPEGENIEFETLELVRLLKPLAAKFDKVDPKTISKTDKRAYAEYKQYKAVYDEDIDELNEEFSEFAQISALLKGAYSYMQQRTGKEELTLNVLMEYKPVDEEEVQIIEFLLMAEKEGIRDYLEEANTYFDRSLNYNYNFEYDPRPIVKEAEAAAKGTGYGNNMVDAANPEHGTHVGGIIGAVRNNGMGVDGIASNAVIMPVRAIPGGDERDEDVALAIRYAADNGARVINMSFGKSYSPRSDLVYEAIRYARSRDVLLISAAGNETRNNDEIQNFPDGTLGSKATIDNWLSVAASGPVNDNTLLADFSNFGPKKVDVLAPGVDILSLFPGDGVKANSGTSMAAPVASGVAVLLRGLYPALNASQIKKLIIESLYYPEGAAAATDKGDVALKKLIRYPGIVNAERAVILAGSKY